MNKRSITYFLTVLFFLLSQTAVFPAVFTVSPAVDGGPEPLRAAVSIAAANGEDNVIYLTAGVYKAWEMDISIPGYNPPSLYIIGEGAASTIIDCDGNNRAFEILGGTVHIMDITIKNGEPDRSEWFGGEPRGGGIYNQGELFLTRCIISDCKPGRFFISGNGGSEGASGGGIFNAEGGRLTMEECIVSGNQTTEGIGGTRGHNPAGDGGGIANEGILNISNCTISNNYAAGGIYSGMGGGIAHSGGSMHISNSTISGNHTGNGQAGSAGGSGGDGGGILINSEYASMRSCTVGDNYTGGGYAGGQDNESGAGCGGGIAVLEGSLHVYASTICNNHTGDSMADLKAGDGGGIYVKYGGELHMTNSLLGDNGVGQLGKGPDASGVINSNGYNLVENLDEIVMLGDSTGNITGQDPMLGPLADNGGFTKTYALQAGSPAIDAGGGSPIFDQRYFTGPADVDSIPNADQGWDIGAYEYNATGKRFMSLSPKLLIFSADTAGDTSEAKKIKITTDANWYCDSYGSFTTIDSWLYETGTKEVTLEVSPQKVMDMAPGTYISKFAASSYQENWSYRHRQEAIMVFTLYDSTETSAPTGSFDTPVSGSTVSSSIPVTGWALDDIGIESIKIYRDPVAGEGSDRVYLGDAMQVENARPDLASSSPSYPGSTKAGWGYMMLTNFLPNGGNGTFSLYAVVTDVEGKQLTMGPKVITCDNAGAVNPFGAIDTPGQGETVSGDEYFNFGWVLTPLPNSIPTDGATIEVFIDGESVGSPAYNVYREDIATLFPGYNNSGGALGHLAIDTTAYANGVHTISWGATDDAGNEAGIGSRYFSIQNETDTSPETAPAVPPKRALRNVAPDRSLLDIKTAEGEFEIEANEKSVFHVEIKETERLVMRLNGQSAGYMDIKGKQVKLPVGSRLDTEKGIFYWQPGPGFMGAYTLVFTGKTEKRVIVTIAPRD